MGYNFVAILKPTMLLLFSCPVMSLETQIPWIEIFQAIILEWVAISFFQGIFPTQELTPSLLPASPALQVDSLLLSPWGSPKPTIVTLLKVEFHGMYIIYKKDPKSIS